MAFSIDWFINSYVTVIYFGFVGLEELDFSDSDSDVCFFFGLDFVLRFAFDFFLDFFFWASELDELELLYFSESELEELDEYLRFLFLSFFFFECFGFLIYSKFFSSF